MRVRAGVALLSILLAVLPASGAGVSRIRAMNVSVQAGVTLISAAARGKVRSWSDFARCLAAGTSSGYGFYEAKRLIGRGDVRLGWMIANLAASVAENSVHGRNPVAQLGYTIGPLRFRVPIPPLDRDAGAWVLVDASAYQAVTLVKAIRSNDRMRLRDGLIGFERRTLYPPEGGVGPFDGETYGIYPGVWIHTTPDVWNHEMIHAVQSLQADSLEPSFKPLRYAPRHRSDGKAVIRFEHLQIGVVSLTKDATTSQRPYEQRWTEIEAYRLAQHRRP